MGKEIASSGHSKERVPLKKETIEQNVEQDEPENTLFVMLKSQKRGRSNDSTTVEHFFSVETNKNG